MDRASLFFLTKGIVTQYFSLLITSLAICKSIFQRFVITVETSLVFIISKARLSFMEREKKKKNKIDISFHRSRPCGVQISKSLEFYHERANCISGVSFFGICSFARFEYQKWSTVVEWGTDHQYPSNGGFCDFVRHLLERYMNWSRDSLFRRPRTLQGMFRRNLMICVGRTGDEKYWKYKLKISMLNLKTSIYL